jgi:multiple sugar transport system substrate-binding protein
VSFGNTLNEKHKWAAVQPKISLSRHQIVYLNTNSGDLLMNKKKLSRRDFLRAAGAGAALFTAGGRIFGQSATATPAPTATPLPLPEGVEGTLSVIHRTEYFAAVQDLFRETVTDFAAQKGMGLDISTANPESFGDFLGKMQAAVNAGNPPDIAYTSNVSIAQMHLLDLLEDVSDVVAEAERLYGPTMPGSSPHKNAQFDGVWKAIPYLANSGAWFVRGDGLAAAGIDPVTGMETYDQRRDAALAMSNADEEFWGWGLTPNQSGDGYGFLTGLINSFGGSYTDETGLVVTFDSPETLAAVEWLTELFTSEKYAPALPPGILSWTDISNNEAYLAGTIGMTLNAFSVYAQAKRDENPVFPNTLVMRPPVGPGGLRTEAGANSWLTIFKGSANIDAAKELALHLLNPEIFTPMAELGGGLFLPAYENLWTEELLAIDPNFATIRDIVSNPEPYIGASWPAEPNAAIDALRAQSVPEQMMANITSGRMTPAEAVADAHQRIVDIFEEGGIEQP